MDIQGSTVLLTGATGGIGQAIARRLRAEGASLVLTGRRADVLEPLAAELEGRAVAVDLAQRGEAERLAAQCTDVDILVANAALPASGDLQAFGVDEIDRALEVNLRAPIVLARLLGERMLERRRGSLVFISSLAGRSSAPGSSVYSATKFGLRGFCQGLRGDLHGTGVNAGVVFPGFVRNAGMFAEAGDVALPRGVGTSSPDEVAAGVVKVIGGAGEVTVAPVGMRFMTSFAEVAPGLSARLARAAGSHHVSSSIAEGQRDKR